MTRSRTTVTLIAGLTLATVGIGGLGRPASAQDAATPLSSRRHVVRVQPTPGDAPVTYRGLTITRPPGDEPDAYGQDDPYADGPVRYNDVRDFSPFPYADSGRQFPFGFDGVGGYGSDLGYNEGQDASVYDRGAFNRDAR